MLVVWRARTTARGSQGPVVRLLEERYARGEITREEFLERRTVLRGGSPAAVQHFVDWLANRPGRAGRLCDRSIANALTPLRLALDAAVAEGLVKANPAEHVVLLRRRAGRAWSARERRF